MTFISVLLIYQKNGLEEREKATANFLTAATVAVNHRPRLMRGCRTW
jgi:hypothetical protein